MKFELAERGRLKLNPDNPKIITEEAINKMVVYLEINGFRDPVEARIEDGLVVAGHRRLLAGDKLGLDLIPTIWHEGMSDEEAKAYTISHSRAEKDVAFNRALLSDQVAGLPEELVRGLGFDETELVGLFDLDRGAGEEGEEGEGEGGVRPALLAGEVWICGPISFRVFKGLNKTSLLAAEELLRKLIKMVKKPCHLEGDEGALFEAVMKERRDAQNDRPEELVVAPVRHTGAVGGPEPSGDRGDVVDGRKRPARRPRGRAPVELPKRRKGARSRV